MKRFLFFIALMGAYVSFTSSVWAVQGGMTAWWVGSDYTNTNAGTAVSWTDRIGSIGADAIAGAGVYPTSNGAGGVVFTRSGDATNSAGSYFSTATSQNPIAGKTKYTILVDLTPTKVGCSGANDAFYKVSGLVGAEQGGVVYDWGLGYDAAKRIVSGYGKGPSDVSLRPATATVELNTEAVAAMVVNGTSLTTWQDGSQIASQTIQNNARNSNVAVYIGRMGADGGYYEGTIKEIRIFTRALGASEVANYTDIMKNGTAVYTWAGGTGVLTDANWTNAAGVAGQSLAANSAAFIESGTVTMTNDPGLKTLTVGDGSSTSTVATLNATNATLTGAQTVILIGGGTISGLGATVSTNNLHVSGGTLSGLTSIYSEDGTATLYMEGGQVNAGGAFNVGNYSGVGGGKFVISGGTFQNSGYFCVGNRSTMGGTMEMSGGTMNLGWLTVGHKTTGTVTMTGGTIVCTDHVSIGEGNEGSTQGNGTINIQGGTMTVTKEISVGTQSTGALNISGGSVTAGSVVVTGNGTMNFSNGTIAAPLTSLGNTQITGGTLSNSLTVTGSKTTWSGGTITGPINVNSGGTLALKNGTRAINAASGEQVLTINGGTLLDDGAGNLSIGEAGQGKVVLNSGNLTYYHDINLGNGTTGTGTIEMNGGKFTSNSFNVGRSGTGNLNIAAGSFSTGYYLSIADQPGSTGNVTVSGGTATAGNTLSVGNRGTGTYTQTGGMVTAGQVQVGQTVAGATGDLDISAGVLKSNGTLKIGGTGTGTMEMSGSATVSTNTLENAQNLTWTGGDLYLGTSATGNLTQDGGTLYVGDQVNTQTLTWTRKTNNAFPGARDAKIKDTSAATVADFWAKSKTTETDYPQSGVTTPSTITVGSASIANYLPQNLGLDYFTIIYEGKISIDSEGDYKFNFKGDDGGFLYVDGECVAHMTLLDDASPWGKASISTAIHLTPGLHDFMFQYYDGYGGNNLTEMNMQKLGDGGAVVSTTNLLDASAPFATVVQNYKNVKVTGDYTQGENAEIVMGINAANGAHDSLEITGQAEFNGALTVNIENDPTFMSDVQIFNAPNAEYNFSEITINSMFPQSVWNLDGLMAGGDGFIRIDRSAVPEPATWVLLLAGLSGIFMISRGKKRQG